MVIGDNPSLSGAPLYIALEKGYYRAVGIDAQLEMSGAEPQACSTTMARRVVGELNPPHAEEHRSKANRDDNYK